MDGTATYREIIRMTQIARLVPKGFYLINYHDFPSEWAAYILKKRFGIPVVWMCNEPPFYFLKHVSRDYYSRAILFNAPVYEVWDKWVARRLDAIMVGFMSASFLVLASSGYQLGRSRLSSSAEPMRSSWPSTLITMSSHLSASTYFQALPW